MSCFRERASRVSFACRSSREKRVPAKSDDGADAETTRPPSLPSTQRPITWIKHVVICIGVRKDSLRKRHGGHGFAYNYVASMLATFSSRMVYAALMGHFVPHPRDFKVGRRMSEATVCWMLVYAIPVGVFANLCGHSIHARWTRSALYLAAALNKFQHVRRILFLVRHRAMPNQIAIMAATGAASTLSRAVTNQWVTSAADEDVEVWLGGLRRVSVELRRNAALGAVEFFLRSDQLESLEALVQCDGTLGSSMMPLCLDADISVAMRARQAVHLLVMAYLVNMYLRRAAKSVAFKRKPPKVKRS